MKLCWDNLKNVKLSTPYDNVSNRGPELAEYYGVEGHQLIKYILEYCKACLYCNNDFLKPVKNVGYFCDNECKKAYHEEKKFEAKCLKYNKNINKPKQKSKYRLKNIGKVDYNIYASRVSYCKTVRRHHKNKDILQIKCDNHECVNWITPSYNSFDSLLRNIEGKANSNPFIFCSNECSVHCKANLRVESIIVQDLINSKNFVDANKLRQKVFNKKATPIIIKFKLANTYIRPKKIGPYKPIIIKPKPIYTDIIISKLNKHILRKNNIKYHAMKHKIKMCTDEKYRTALNAQSRAHYLNLRKSDPKLYTLKRLLAYSKVRSKQKCLDNNLDLGWLYEQTKNKCPKTDIEFRYDPNIIRDIYAPSIDRIDSDKGYTKDNCQVVIWGYNCAKGLFTDKDLYTMLKCIV